jgi:hypothetical protein
MNVHPAEFAAALIFNADGEMLLLERAPDLARWPGRWGIAGGGVEAGETPRQALRRELRLRMLRGPETLKAVGGYGGRIHIWQATWVDGTIALSREHTRYAWVGPEAYARLDIMPGVDYDLDHFGIWPQRERKGL